MPESETPVRPDPSRLSSNQPDRSNDRTSLTPSASLYICTMPSKKPTLGVSPGWRPTALQISADTKQPTASLYEGSSCSNLTCPPTPAAPPVSADAAYHRRCLLLTLRSTAAGALAVALAAAITRRINAKLSGRRWRLILPVSWIAAEAGFFLWYLRRYAKLNRQPHLHEPSQHDAMQTFERLLTTAKAQSQVVNANTFLSLWFCGANISEIRRGNVAELLAYGEAHWDFQLSAAVWESAHPEYRAAVSKT